MKLIKTASGKTNLKISREEWEKIGNTQGWMKTAQRAIPVGKPGVAPGTGMPAQQPAQQAQSPAGQAQRLPSDPNAAPNADEALASVQNVVNQLGILSNSVQNPQVSKQIQNCLASLSGLIPSIQGLIG